jgi:TolB-like protein
MKRIVPGFFFLLFIMGCAAIHPPGQLQQSEPSKVSTKESTVEILQANLDQEAALLPNSVGVLPFKERGEESGLGLAATEFFTANLGMVQDLALIDLSTTSILETEMAAFSPDKKQRALRAEQVVTGYVTRSGGRLFVNGMQRTQETADYNPLAELDGKESDFFRLVADLDIRYLEKRGIVVTKEMADRFYEVPTENIAAYILYAKGRQAEYLGNFAEAQAAYQQAAEMDPDFDEAEKGSERVERQIAVASELAVPPAQPVSEDLFTSPVEQPPSIEEKNAPATGNTGTVIIRFDLP